MTYYLSRDREDEVSARVEYLYRVFHTHFLRVIKKAVDFNKSRSIALL